MGRARLSQRRATRRRRCELFEAAAEIIGFDYGEQLTLDELARRLYASPRQLQRAFSEVAGTGFRDYLTRVRMGRALELLRQSPYRVSEVARAVGYQEPAQFAKAFRRLYGVSPAELRRGSSNGEPRPSIQRITIQPLGRKPPRRESAPEEWNGHLAGREKA